MIEENEIWGVLTKEEFTEKLKEFGKKFGEPIRQKRLAIQILDLDETSLWSRIRITDGKVELMQKLGSWDIGKQQEISVTLDPNMETIYNLYLILKNLLKKGRLQVIIIQHENYLYETSGFEIKLSHQFGKSSKYPFEIESINGRLNLIEIADKLGLRPNTGKKGEGFWNKWNKAVNLDGQKMSGKDIKDIIKKYL